MELNQNQLAAKYGCTQSSISEFITRHADEVASKKQALSDELHGLWVADRSARMAEYQQTLDDLEGFVSNSSMSDKEAREAVALKLRTLRQVADELGQVPQRSPGTTGGTVTISIDGVELGDLR